METLLSLALPFVANLKASACLAVFVAPTITYHAIMAISSGNTQRQKRKHSSRLTKRNPYALPLAVRESLCLPQAAPCGVVAALPPLGRPIFLEREHNAGDDWAIACHLSLSWIHRDEERDAFTGATDIDVSVDGMRLAIIHTLTSVSDLKASMDRVTQALNSHLHFCAMLHQTFFASSSLVAATASEHGGNGPVKNAHSTTPQIRLSIDSRAPSSAATRAQVGDSQMYLFAAHLLETYFNNNDQNDSLIDPSHPNVQEEVCTTTHTRATVTLIAGNDPLAFCTSFALRHPKLAERILDRVQTIQCLDELRNSVVCVRNVSASTFSSMKHMEAFLAYGAPMSSISGLLTTCQHLHVLDLSATLITDADIVIIAKHGSDRITSLALQECDRITSIDALSNCRKLETLVIAECWSLYSFGKVIATLASSSSSSSSSSGALKRISISILKSSLEADWMRVIGGGGINGRDNLPNFLSSSITSLELRTIESCSSLLTKLCQCDRQQPATPSWQAIVSCRLGVASLMSTVQSLVLHNIGPVARGHPQQDEIFKFVTHFSRLRSFSISRCSSFFGNSNPNMMVELVQHLQLLTSLEISHCGDSHSLSVTAFATLHWLKVSGFGSWRGEPRRWNRVHILGVLPATVSVTLGQHEIDELTKNVYDFSFEGL